MADELNVKRVDVVLADDATAASFGLVKSISVNARALGPRVGKDVQRIIQAAKAGNWSVDGGSVIVDGTQLQDGEYEISMVAAAEQESSAVGLTATGFVLLDTEVSAELAAEGLARDAVRHIQQARKDAGLDVSDRIKLILSADGSSVPALTKHESFIASETLAVEIKIEAGSGEFSVGDTGMLGIQIEKAS